MRNVFLSTFDTNLLPNIDINDDRIFPVSFVTNGYISKEWINHLSNSSIAHLGWEQLVQTAMNNPSICVKESLVNISLLNNCRGIDVATLLRQFRRHYLLPRGLVLFEPVTEILLYNYQDYISRYDPKVILSFGTTHSFGDYALTALAHTNNIPSAFIFSASMLDSLKIQLQRVINTKTGCHFNVSALHSTNKALEIKSLKQLYKSIKHPVPYDQKKINSLRMRKSASNAEALSCILSGDKTVTDLAQNFLLSKITAINHINNNSCAYAEIKPNTIVLCLHVEPEANMSPLGFQYQDQLRFALMLDRICRKKGWYMLIKDHPFQLGLPVTGFSINAHVHSSEIIGPRPLAFYRFLDSLKSVYGYIPAKLPLSELLLPENDIIGLASVNGAAALQAACSSKLGIVGTSTWYSNCPNVYQIDQLIDSCKNNCQNPSLVTEAEFIDCVLPKVFATPSIDSKNSAYHALPKLRTLILS